MESPRTSALHIKRRSRPFCSIVFHIGFLAAMAVMIAGCASYEKRVDLTYERGMGRVRSSGEVYVAKTVIKDRLPRLPGGRVVLGTVGGTATQIVTSDDVERWVQAALMDELFASGYEVRTVPSLPHGVPKGVVVRIQGLSVNQESDGLILRTVTDITLMVDLWKSGRLINTVTISAGGQDEGIDRSGAVVSLTLEATLRKALGKLMPTILENL